MISPDSIVLTHHARQRLSERKLDTILALDTVQHPDRVLEGKKEGTREYIKRHGTYIITAITREIEDNRILVVSVWIDPPMSGTKDEKQRNAYLKMKKGGFLSQIWFELKRQFFGWS